MAIKILVNGYAGKMGQLVCNNFCSMKEFKLIHTSNNYAELIQGLAKKPDIAIDFTNANVVYENTLSIIEHGVRPVIGTSGLSQTEIKQLQLKALAQQTGGIIAPNFSIGMMTILKALSVFSSIGNNVEIIEHHHQYKLDKPSGTARHSADLIEEYCHSKANIHSLRTPGVIANQDIIFSLTGETVTISHRTISRDSFIAGIVFACKEAVKLNELVYGLENLL